MASSAWTLTSYITSRLDTNRSVPYPSHRSALESLLADTLQQIKAATGMEMVAIYLRPEDVVGVACEETGGPSATELAQLYLAASEGIPVTALTSQATVVGDHLWTEALGATVPAAITEAEWTVAPLLQPLRAAGARAGVWIPLLTLEDPVGVAIAGTGDPGRMEDLNFESLRTLGHQLGTAIERARLVDQIQRHRSELAALHRIGMNLSTPLNLNESLEAIVATVRELVLSAETCIILYDPVRKTVRFGAGASMPGIEAPVAVSTYHRWLLETVLQSDQPLIVEDIQDHPGLSRIVDWPVRAVAALPLQHGDTILGVLTVTFLNSHRFSPDELQVLNIMGHQAAIAVENARLFDDLLQHIVGLTSLQQIAASVVAELELHHALDLIAQKSAQLTQAGSAVVSLLNPDGQTYTCVATYGTLGEQFQSKTYPAEAGLPGQAMQLGEGFIVGDLVADERAASDPGRELGCHSAIVAPLQLKQRAIGCLVAYDKHHGEPFGEQDFQLLSTFATQAALVIENARLFTETERLKQFNENIVQMMEQGIIIEDADGRITFVNPKAGEMLGTTEKSILGLHGSEIIAATFRKQVELERQRLREGHKSHYEAALVTKDGRELPVIISATPLFNSGHYLGTLAVVTDITQRKEIEEMKTNFVNTVSHELRTPLHAIRGFVELLLQDQVPDPAIQNEFLTIVRDQTLQLNRLVDDLLDLARMESHRMVMRREPVDLWQVTQRTVQHLEPVARQKSLNLEIVLQGESAEVQGDSDGLKRVLTNLIGNAIKFTDEKGTITIRGQFLRMCNGTMHYVSPDPFPLAPPEALPDGDWVVLSITDTGIGIPPEAVPKLFGRFYQVDNSATRKAGGSGLGLYISKQIVEAHGGRIWAQSEVGKGSTFAIALPAGQIRGDLPSSLNETCRKE